MTPSAADATDAQDTRSWHRYRLVADTSQDVIYETDSEGIIQWISPSVRELLGWEPAQLQGRPSRDLVHPLDLERIDALRTSLYREGRTHNDVTCMLSTATGGYREVTLRARPLLDAHDVVVGAVVTAADTHDRDSALRALTTLSQATRALVRSSDETDLLQRMCDTVVQAGRYLFTWYGRAVDDPEQSVQPVAKAGEHHGYLDEISVSWGDSPHGRGPTGRCLRSGQTQIENDFSRDPEYQPWEEAATGRGFKSSISLPVMVSGTVDGALMVYAAEPGAFDALAQDLLEDLAADLGYGIERLRGAEELARTTQRETEQRQRLLSTLDSQFDPFVLLAAVRDEAGQLVDLRYVEANAAAVEYNQLPRDELIGTCVLDRYPNQRGTRAIELYFRTIETGEPTILDDYAYENLIIGNERRYDIRAVKSGDAVALTWRDVTDRHAAAQNLADSERRYRLLTENASDVVLLSDEALNVTWVSASVRQTLGWEPTEMVGLLGPDFVHPDDRPGLIAEVAAANAEGRPSRFRYRWRRPDGTYRWMEGVGRRIDDGGLGGSGRVVGLRAIDAQVEAEQALAARESQYRLLAENASDIVWQISPDGLLEWTSPSITRVLGWQPEAIIGRNKMDLIHPEDRRRAALARAEVLAGRAYDSELRLLRPDGSARWMSMAIHPVPTDHGIARIVNLRDIQDEVRARDQLEFALGHDKVTGLPGREGMLDRVAYAQSQLTEFEVLAVLFVGIDALAEVNEALSHGAGDNVLRTVAARVVQASPSPDLVGRGTGDEFIVILPVLAAGPDAAEPTDRIRVAVHGPIDIAGHQVSPTASIGIAVGTRDTDTDSLLRDAALALRQAKESGRDRSAFVDASMAVEAERRLALESDIRDGLRTGAFVPWFQPIVSLADARVEGYEALVRWMRPDGSLEPDDFIPVASRTTLITEIDLAMLGPVTEALSRLPESVFIAVNVTGLTLARTPYADLVAAALQAHGVDASRLHVEVTETMLLALDDAVVTQIRNLADLGCRWYVDDFGTGYSSISHLRDLPVSGLKLDKSFTFGIGAGERTDMQLAGALIGLANGLGLDTVAEGVETQAEADYLRTLGWRHGQGWLYGKAAPLP